MAERFVNDELYLFKMFIQNIQLFFYISTESEETTDVAKDKDDEDDSQFFSMAQKAMKKLDSKTTNITKPSKKPSVVSPSQSRLFPLRPMVF